MIELNEQQRQAVHRNPSEPVRLVDPETNRVYVLVGAEEFERMRLLAYDDSPWTDEKKAMLAAEAGESIGWDDMGEYDDYDRPHTLTAGRPIRLGGSVNHPAT